MGINVGWGQDCVLDPWYSLGTADMLDVAFMGLHVAQMTSPDDMRTCFDMVTVNNAKTMGLTDYGLRIGAKASLVVLDASNPIEALRLRAARLYVVANGRVISQTPRADATLCLPGDFTSSPTAELLARRLGLTQRCVCQDVQNLREEGTAQTPRNFGRSHTDVE